MTKCLKSALAGVALGSLAILNAQPAMAASVTAEANGSASYGSALGTVNTGFYTLAYGSSEGPAPSITSVSYDLSGNTHQSTDPLTGKTYTVSGYFNFDPTVSTTKPELGALSGLSASDVSFNWTYTGPDYPGLYSSSGTQVHYNHLTVNFAPNTFRPGDSLTFGVGTEWVDGTNSGTYGGNSGGDLGNAHIPMTIAFSNGKSVSAVPLGYVSPSLSSLTVTAPAAVPLPGAVWLFGSGLVGLAGFARRRGK